MCNIEGIIIIGLYIIFFASFSNIVIAVLISIFYYLNKLIYVSLSLFFLFWCLCFLFSIVLYNVIAKKNKRTSVGKAIEKDKGIKESYKTKVIKKCSSESRAITRIRHTN